VRDREKAGFVELGSTVYVHVMVTELFVLEEFEECAGAMPVLNKHKVAKHAP
jgi:hypothetical protein